MMIAAATAAALLLPGTASAAPGEPPTPTIASVTARLDALGRQTEVLAERFNQARIDVAAAQLAADAADQGATAAASRYQVARGQFVAIASARYEGGSFSNTGALLSSQNGDGYLDSLSTLDGMSTHQAGVIAEVGRAKSAATGARKHAADLLAVAEARRADVAKQRAAATAETDKFRVVLQSLTAAQQAAYRAREAATARQLAATLKAQARQPAAQPAPQPGQPAQPKPGPPAAHATRASAQRAVDFAMAQLGKPYAFGASGPNAYDCSGLTMAAWAAGGVSLPHQASSQYGYGTHVLASELQPGDLVFLYSPIGHVSIYVGNGMAVSAPQTGDVVKLVPFSHFAADFVGATRP